MDLKLPPKFKNYILKNKIIIKREILPQILAIDAIIFDLDGVLLDVYSSFRKATSLAVQFYFKKILNYKGQKILLSPQQTEYFKISGKFNDDHDLTKAAIYFYLTKAVKNNCKSLEEIYYSKPELKDFLIQVKNAGGGISNLKKIASKLLNKREQKFLSNNYDEAKAVKIVSEIYAGKDTEKVYGFKPTYFKNLAGVGKNEKILLKQKLNNKLTYAILTGRNLGETNLALKCLSPYLKIPRKNILCSDDGIKKPSAKPLQILAKRLQFKTAIYVGDTLDDLNCVNLYNQKNPKQKILSCQILTKLQAEEKIILFLQQHADLITKNVNNVLQLINKTKNKQSS